MSLIPCLHSSDVLSKLFCFYFCLLLSSSAFNPLSFISLLTHYIHVSHSMLAQFRRFIKTLLSLFLSVVDILSFQSTIIHIFINTLYPCLSFHACTAQTFYQNSSVSISVCC